MERIIIAGTSRGLSLEGIMMMDLGQVIDLAIEYNSDFERAERKKKRKEKKRRKATQADWNAFFGG